MRQRSIRRIGWTLSVVLMAVVSIGRAEESRFATTDSSNQYVHYIDLYDSTHTKIAPSPDGAAPYSPKGTCGKCHDYEAMSHGWHFNAAAKLVDPGRPGEPWIWSDERTGTQIPMSYRDWPRVLDPQTLGMTPHDFTKTFGHHLPGGGTGEMTETEDEAAKAAWAKSGALEIDCMLCHSGNRRYSFETWAEHVEKGDFAAASTAALSMGKITGSGAAAKVVYNPNLFESDGKVYFDVIRKPMDNTCYYCHSTRSVGQGAAPKWNHDEDVHVRAGFGCADCHRNGVEHHTVRGFEGEPNAEGQDVVTLSCRGCHYNTEKDGKLVSLGGRLGAPDPIHEDFPPIHFEKMSCTSCHSGPRAEPTSGAVQTAMAHLLGIPEHGRPLQMLPRIAQPVFERDQDGVIYPYRVMWPAFWGYAKGDAVRPIDPETAYKKLRSALRVRKNLREELMDPRISPTDKAKLLGEERAKVKDEELTDEEKAKLDALKLDLASKDWDEKLVKALGALAKDAGEGEKPVYVAAGRKFELSEDGKSVVAASMPDNAYRWPLGHNVRSARQALGATGCIECHTTDSNFFFGKVTTSAPLPVIDTDTTQMHERIGEGTEDYIKITNGVFKFFIIATVVGLLLHMAGDFLSNQVLKRRGDDDE